MFRLIWLLLGMLLRALHTRRNLMMENLTLRQQLAVFKSKTPRLKLGTSDKFFWILARCFWAGWKNALPVVTPETVVRWYRAGFRLYWTWLSRR
jgi:hypothetical protein